MGLQNKIFLLRPRQRKVVQLVTAHADDFGMIQQVADLRLRGKAVKSAAEDVSMILIYLRNHPAYFAIIQRLF
ncbi:hypothetical protein FNJ84_17045 [Paracoccus sp. M683]|uniref:hypothetical protein n=1 Tax=Paracoccus sp. M683 TaxID=2594268 RepID=UPI00117E1DE0|nr:hypothetical protein [Paracoccus sp. M683]TRW95202.1 hypothetical protein FNJ84_17045 [Paracoccus sp. M683]